MSSLDSFSDDDDDVRDAHGNKVFPAGTDAGSAYKVDSQEDFSQDTQEVMRALDGAVSRKRRRRPKLGPDGQIIADGRASCRELVKEFMDDSNSSRPAAFFHLFLLLSIVASTIIVICSTVEEVTIPQEKTLELIFNILFSAELFVRLAVADTCSDNCSDPFLWIDALAILPYWLEVGMNLNGGFIFEVLQAMRILRLLKLSRHFDHESIILARAIQVSYEALIVPFFFLGIVVVVFAVFLYYFEKEGARAESAAQLSRLTKTGTPEQIAGFTPTLSAFASIPDSIWFMLVTMTTVGYGDISPNTHVGKGITVAAMVFGVLFLAMPLSIVGNNFVEVWNDRERVIFIEKLKDSLLHNQVKKETFQTAFDELDKDGSGSLSFKEFKIALNNLQLNWPPKQLLKLWNAIDSDKSGEIQKNEFMNLLFETADGDDVDDVEAPLQVADNMNEGESFKSIAQQLARQNDAIASLQDRSNQQFADLKKQIDKIQTLLMNSTITRSEFKTESFKVEPGPNRKPAARKK